MSFIKLLKMKFFVLLRRSPTLHRRFWYDEELLRENDIVVAGIDDHGNIWVDSVFKKLRLEAKIYALLHEEGHIVLRHHATGTRIYGDELEADNFALRHLGKDRVIRSMFQIMKEISEKTDFSAACDFILRLYDLGVEEMSEFEVTLSDNTKVNVDYIRSVIDKYGYKKRHKIVIKEGLKNGLSQVSQNKM